MSEESPRPLKRARLSDDTTDDAAPSLNATADTTEPAAAAKPAATTADASAETPCSVRYTFDALTAVLLANDEEGEAFAPTSACTNNFLKGFRFSPDGTCVLTSSEDSRLRLFELPRAGTAAAAAAAAGAKAKAALTVAPGEAVYDMCWFPQMHSLKPETCFFLSTCRGHPIQMWDAYTGAMRSTYRAFNHLDENTAAFSLAMDPGGTSIFAGFDRMVRIFDVTRPGRECEARPTKKTRKARRGQAGIISSLSVSPTRPGLYAAGSFGGSTCLYARDGSRGAVCRLGGHVGGVTHVCFSPCGNFVFTGARKDGDVLCWDIRFVVGGGGGGGSGGGGGPVLRLPRAADTNQRLGFGVDPSGKYVITATSSTIVAQDGKQRLPAGALVYDVLAPAASTDAGGSRPPALKVSTDTRRSAEVAAIPSATLVGHVSRVGLGDMVNWADFHPFEPMVGVSTGQRHFNVGDSDDDSSSDEENEEGRAGQDDVRSAKQGGEATSNGHHGGGGAAAAAPDGRCFRNEMFVAKFERHFEAVVEAAPSE